MPRKGENIYRRADGRWEVRCIKGYDELTGKAKYQYLYAPSYQEARRLKAKATGEHAPRKPKAVTVEQCYREWIAWKSSSSEIHCSTVNQYVWYAENHILPFLGKAKVGRLNATALDQFRREKLSLGKLDGRGGLSSYTVSTIMMVLSSILSYAEEEGYIKEIPRRKSPDRGGVKHKKAIRVLSRSEQAALEKILCEGFSDKELYGIYLGIFFSLYTGMRVGELGGLQWQDVNIEEGIPTITVRRTLQRTKAPEGNLSRTMLYMGPPKSSSSCRRLPLKAEFLPLLQQYYDSLPARLKKPESFVFARRGKPVEPRAFQEQFKRVLKKAGIAAANFHCLRHTFATRCIESNMDVQSLSECLGHSSANITLKVYAHSFMTQKEACINRLDFMCDKDQKNTADR